MSGEAEQTRAFAKVGFFYDQSDVIELAGYDKAKLLGGRLENLCLS